MLTVNSAIVRQTADAIRALRDRGVMYANIFSPLDESRLAEALAESGVQCRVDRLSPRDQELIAPAVYGYFVMTLSDTLNAKQRSFATRHGFGHVVAGHVSDVVMLSSERGWLTDEERVADLFALADIVPCWLLDDLRRSRTSWRAMQLATSRIIEEHTIGWSLGRVEDRTYLRIDLYRSEAL